ncbi:hypothetical protein LQ948_05875 [Jiella sp. MQZ9-1]|uniref:Uncharacterized protein n=1 Tax=Jiella flava TaxID=2816857 RepID=A0A939JRI2_9HYPH|nr:hypothetical protein [Jiella flava]MBO0661938.1 hypothetical protein [Jiella flava]MCD2470734.1 hypothetical protein [Jiella flava]
MESTLPGVEARLERIDRDVTLRGLKSSQALSVANRARLRYTENGYRDDGYPAFEPGVVLRLDQTDDPAFPELSPPAGVVGAGLVLHDCVQQSWVLTLCAADSLQHTLMPSIMIFLQRLAPDLLNAFTVSHAIGSPDQPSRTLIEHVWDQLPAPAMLLDAELSIGAMNVAAEALHQEARYFRPNFVKDHLRLANREDTYALEAGIGRLLHGRSANSRRESTRIVLNGVGNQRPLKVELHRAGSSAWRRQFVPELAASSHVVAVFPDEEHSHL